MDIYYDFQSAFDKIQEYYNKDKLVIAIDGMCASGKTTFAKFLQDKTDCNIFHVDDYYLRPEQRTSEHISQVGGNFDIERFTDEVINGINSDKTFSVRRYDCKQGILLPFKKVQPKKLSIIEGSYSCHPNLQKYYDLMIFLKVSPTVQRERILKRNPDTAQVFFNKWIILENNYFSAFSIEEKCNMTIINE